MPLITVGVNCKPEDDASPTRNECADGRLHEVAVLPASAPQTLSAKLTGLEVRFRSSGQRPNLRRPQTALNPKGVSCFPTMLRENNSRTWPISRQLILRPHPLPSFPQTCPDFASSSTRCSPEPPGYPVRCLCAPPGLRCQSSQLAGPSPPTLHPPALTRAQSRRQVNPRAQPHPAHLCLPRRMRGSLLHENPDN